jgi:hypothetical protein
MPVSGTTSIPLADEVVLVNAPAVSSTYLFTNIPNLVPRNT